VLAAHDFLRLRRELGCTEDELRLANALIRSCDPKPGERFGRDETRYVVPDVLVRKVDDHWIATVNAAAVPDVRINHAYAVILRRRREECSAQFAQQLQEARWTIRNLRQRFSTIQRVAEAIVERQRRFLEYGPIAMKPLMMRDIAGGVGLHESTVSRAVNGKYMATPRGLFELRHFFGSHVVTVDGMACSSTAIRALIRQIIAAEPHGRPLSDIKVTRILSNRGVRVARRTVSKYRDAMRIPPVEARRMAA
jgi:RNA polymerase sigma-54 factor